MVKDLRRITVIGLGLLGGSIALSVLRSFARVKVVGYSHRAATRDRALRSGVVTEIVDDMRRSVSGADVVILATPICTFEDIFAEISDALPAGCIVTDVGSTKVLPHRWAARRLPAETHYVGSHPIAGSEQRGVEFARDDLFYRAMCILTTTGGTNPAAVKTLAGFWSRLGCVVKLMSPGQHDRVFANISHVPHVTAAALINANKESELEFAGKGFIDTSRIASGPANIWTDVLSTNSANIVRGIDRVIAEMSKLREAVAKQDKKKLESLLRKARAKRSGMIEQKIEKKELIS